MFTGRSIQKGTPRFEEIPIRVSSHSHLPEGAFGGDEFTSCGGDFGGKKLNRRRIVGGKDEARYAVFERDSREIVSPLLRRSVEQGTP